MALCISPALGSKALVIKLSVAVPENALLTLNGLLLTLMAPIPLLPYGPYLTPKSAMIIESPDVSNH